MLESQTDRVFTFRDPANTSGRLCRISLAIRNAQRTWTQLARIMPPTLAAMDSCHNN